MLDLKRLKPIDFVNISVVVSSLLIFYFFQQILPEMSQGVLLNEEHKVNGVTLKASGQSDLSTLPWPTGLNGRKVNDGNLDETIVKPVPANPSKELIVRVDGSTLYRSKNGNSFKILIKNEENVVEYIIPSKNGVQIEANTAHSYPFGDDGGIEEVSRQTNGVTLLNNFNEQSAKVERKTLERTFVDGTLQLEEATTNAAYDVVLQSSVEGGKFQTTSGKSVDTMTPASWPHLNTPLYPSRVPTLEQEFTMEWVDQGDTKEILFKGLSGHLTGGEGRPGVIFDKTRNIISINLLLSRPDGSFFISTDQELIMIVAQSDSNGEPIKSTLEAIIFKNGAKLPTGWWHSVPFPRPNQQKIHLYEKIASTDANIVLNVLEEAGAPLVIQL
ncbi:unnamed protein product, partial [Mesorhabditis belari]|uniref:Uncharacterized protein n=1 Tax=Mesorhabditis belari TaxID=2138241 RepID=A0AAF3F3F1_9BILA